MNDTATADAPPPVLPHSPPGNEPEPVAEAPAAETTETNATSTATAAADIEAQATELGWTSKEEWIADGKNPEKWRDPKKFMEYSHRHNGVLRQNVDKLSNELIATKRHLAELSEATGDFAKFKENAERRAYERAKASLKEQISEAVSASDGAKVSQLLEARDELTAAAPQPTKAPAAPRDPRSTVPPEWLKENDWYGNDTELTAFADKQARFLRHVERDTSTGNDFLKKVTDEVRSRYPDKFKAAATTRERPPSPDRGGLPEGSRGKVGKRYEDLPPDAKAACDKFVKQKLLTRDQYLSEYFGG